MSKSLFDFHTSELSSLLSALPRCRECTTRAATCRFSDPESFRCDPCLDALEEKRGLGVPRTDLPYARVVRALLTHIADPANQRPA